MSGKSLPARLFLAAVFICAARAGGASDRRAPPEEQVFAKAQVIVDVSIDKAAEEGYVVLQVHEYLRGSGAPKLVRAGTYSRNWTNIGSLAGGRYVLFAVGEHLNPEEVYAVRLKADGQREVEYEGAWIPFDAFKKRIPEPLILGERDPRKVLAALGVFGPEAVLKADASLRTNKEFMKVAVLIDLGTLSCGGPTELRGDREFVLRTARRHPEAVTLAASNLWNDREFVLEAARLAAVAKAWQFTVLGNASPALRDDRDLVMELVRHNGRELQWASERLRADRAVVEAAGGLGLYHADPALLDDRELVLNLVRQNGNALGAASYRLKTDREVVLAAMRAGSSLFSRLPEKLRADREVVLAAVGNYGDNLMSASEEFKNDREIVLAAVRNNPRAVTWAGPQTKRNPEICLEAVRRDGYAIQNMDRSTPDMRRIALEALRQNPASFHSMLGIPMDDPAFLREAVPLCPRLVGYLPDAVRRNEALYKELILAALEKDEAALAGLPGIIQGDPEFVLKAGAKRFYALAYAQGPAAEDPRVLAMKDDRKRLEQAIEQGDVYALGAASARLQSDPEIVRKVVTSSKVEGKYLASLIRPSLWDDRQVILKLLGAAPQLIMGAPWKARADRELALAAIEKDGAVFPSLDRLLRADRQVVLAALKSRPDLVEEIMRAARGGVQWDDEVRAETARALEKLATK